MIVDKAMTAAAQKHQREGIQRVRKAFNLDPQPAPCWWRAFAVPAPRVRPFPWRGRKGRKR